LQDVTFGGAEVEENAGVGNEGRQLLKDVDDGWNGGGKDEDTGFALLDQQT
jgi:hypothetical protein